MARRALARSLGQAIASDYGLELFETKLAKNTDAKSQSTFKTLSSRCVVLVQDIDAAGIGREDLVQAEKVSKEKMEKRLRQDEWGQSAEETFEHDPVAYCQKTDIEFAPEQSFIISSGLLNTLDRLGAKGGRFVVLTTGSFLRWALPARVRR